MPRGNNRSPWVGRAFGVPDYIPRSQTSRTSGDFTMTRIGGIQVPFHTNEKLYVDADGNPCAEDDENAFMMVAAANTDVDDETAALYGLHGSGDKADAENTFHDNTMTPLELKSLQNTARLSAATEAERVDAKKALLNAKPAGNGGAGPVSHTGPVLANTPQGTLVTPQGDAEQRAPQRADAKK